MAGPTKKATPARAATYTEQVTGDVYEVMTLNAAGRGTVHRVHAGSKAEAEKFVTEALGLTAPGRPRVAEVASPADLRARERAAQAERQKAERAAARADEERANT